jgi:hypothetical protein
MRKVISLFFTIALLWADAKYASPLPPPKLHVIDIDPKKCDKECLMRYFESGKILSGAAKASSAKKEPSSFEEYLKKYPDLFDYPATTQGIQNTQSTLELDHDQVKIAILGDKKRHKQILKRIASLLAALFLQHHRPFNIQTIHLPADATSLPCQKLSDFDLAIAIIPYSKSHLLSTDCQATTTFVPTLHKRLVNSAPDGIYFGGIDYFEHIERLLDYSKKRLVVFTLKDSPFSQKLTDHLLSLKPEAKVYTLTKNSSSFGHIFRRHSRYKALFFNTPLLTTSLILTQLTLHGHTSTPKLSTQINFHQKLFDLTQEQDRKGLIMAISTLNAPQKVDALAELVGVNLAYDWLGYNTIMGAASLFLKDHTLLFDGYQLQHHTTILRYTTGGFTQISP